MSSAEFTIHSARGDGGVYSFKNLREDIKSDVQEYIQRVFTVSDEKHAAQIALLREENELRVQQVKDELSQKHADDMVAMRNEFETQIKDLNLQLEIVTQAVENQLKSADVDMGHESWISDNTAPPETDSDDTFDGASRPLDEMSWISEQPAALHNANETNRKSASSQINGRYSRVVRDGGNVPKRTSRQATGEARVAFFAAMNAHNTHLGANHDLVFEEVTTNIGNAYNSHHGTFVAPVDGVYVFSCTLANNADQMRGQFMVNGSIVAKFYGNSATNWHSSQTIVVALKKGYDVSVQNTGYYVDVSVYGHYYSTFSGFLLYEDFSNTPGIVG